MSFTIKVCSDLHINRHYPNFPTVRQLFNTNDSFIADICILIGDITYFELIKFYKRFLTYISPYFTLLVLIPGNHEYYNNTSKKRSIKELDQIVERTFRDIPNLEILNNRYIDIGDVRIFGSILWSYVPTDVPDRGLTIYSDTSRVFFPKLLSRSEYNQLNYESIRSLLQCIEKTKRDGMSLIVATHYSPTFEPFGGLNRNGKPDDLMNYWYCNNLDDLINKNNMAIWLFGHTHTPHDEVKDGTIVLSNPYVPGYSPLLELRIN